jgi:AIPR protein
MATNLRQTFSQALRQQARQTSDPPHRAFIKWYVRTRFGTAATCDITDGTSDGGIDAIVTEPRLKSNAIYVLQSKFHDGFWKGRDTPLSIAQYLAFDSMPSRFRDNQRFEDWLGTVALDLRPKYRELRSKLEAPGTAAAWQLITLHSRSRSGEDRLQELGPDSFIYGAQHVQLFLMSKEGATPPADPLTLRFTKSMTVEDESRGVTSYVFAAYLKDFVDFMDHDVEDRLFARNVRLDLRSDINKQIRQTYLNSPHEFWYSHNGITVVCTKAPIEGQRVRLVNPSVINGSQTLHSLKGIDRRDPDAQVLTRVLVVQPDNARHPTRKFVNDVIYRMNQQNPMKASNLRANDDIQVELGAAFAPHKVFYERREGEWAARKRLLRNQGFRRLRSRDLAQLLAACDTRFGPATARGKIDLLFDEPIYDLLFYQDFNEILLKWLMYEYVRGVILDTRIRATKPRQRRQALWLILHVAYQCIRRSPSYRALTNNPATTRHLQGYTDESDRLWDVCAGVLRDCWSAWEAANRKDPQLDPNNFFKTEGRTQELSRRLIVRHERRGARAARDLVTA